MTITKNLLTPNIYSRPQKKLTSVKKIAIHYVGNAGSTAIANRNYFESLKSGKKNNNNDFIYASSHYIVGLQGEIIQCVPESEISYCTNSANSYSISIENCHPSTDGKFNAKTNASLIDLCADICIRYNLNPDIDMIRHYDVTGKKCPLYHVNYPVTWLQLKKDVKSKIDEIKGGNEVLTDMLVSIDGKQPIKIPSVLKDGLNYPNLRELSKLLNVEVGWDAKNSTVLLDTKK